MVFGLYTGWFRAPALVLGYAVGLIDCSATALSDGLVPLHALTLGGEKYTIYIGLSALLANIAVTIAVNLFLSLVAPMPAKDWRAAQ